MATTSLRFSNGILSAGSVGAVVAGMAAIDETVRKSVASLLQGQIPAETVMRQASIPVAYVGHMWTGFSDSIGLSGGNHFMLGSFAVAGVVLFILMFRS